jgi:hypothetical protein
MLVDVATSSFYSTSLHKHIIEKPPELAKKGGNDILGAMRDCWRKFRDWIWVGRGLFLSLRMADIEHWDVERTQDRFPLYCFSLTDWYCTSTSESHCLRHRINKAFTENTP